MILVIDTSDKMAKISLDGKLIEWEGGRELSATIFNKLDDLYASKGANFSQTKGIIVNAGPGSFTGLRIGISIANAMAYALNIPIVGVAKPHDFSDLVQRGQNDLEGLKDFSMSVEPFYGSEPNITKPKDS